MTRFAARPARTLFALLLVALCGAVAHPVAAADWPLLYLTTPEGEARLWDATHRDHYISLASYMESEEVVTFCGPATVTIVANAIGLERPEATRWAPYRLWTQDELFEAAGQKPKVFGEVMSVGLTLAELGQFIDNVGLTSEVHFASDLTVESFREIVTATLSDPAKRLVVNFDREVLGQEGTGHISPIGAYDAATDSVLILDVARYKYPPVWLSLEGMLAAMMPADSSSGKSRGTVVISLPQ